MKTTNSNNSSLSPQLTQRLDKHLIGCSAAALGVVSLMSTQGSAQAQIVYSGIQNLPVHPSAVNGGLYFDFENPANWAQGTTPRTDPNTLVPGWDANPYAAGGSLYVNTNTKVVVSGANAANLIAGTLIGPSSTFNGPNGAGVGFYGAVAVPAGTTGFVGFSFDPQSVAGAQTWYGWFRVSPASSGDGTIVDWAYDNTGAAINAGVVPEPSSIALLALGTAGVLALRRRRTQA